MAWRPQELLLVAVATLAVLAQLHDVHGASFPCCANQADNTPYESCTCLNDNTWIKGEVLGAGAKRFYHWRLTDWDLINVPDAERPDISFEVHPCSGSVELYVSTLGLPFPDSGTAQWRSTNEAAVNSLTTPLVYSEYLITVEATATAEYSIVAVVDGSLPVPLGAAGVVTALPIEDDETILYEDDTMSMLVQFTASSRPGVEYRVFAAETGPGPLPCQTGASTGSCIVTSVCGLETGGMVAKTGWATQDANSLVSLTVDGLKQDQEYVFNVAARDGDWQASYVATQGTPSYKRETRAQDDDTVFTIVMIAAGVFVLLVILILWARSRLAKAYHRQHSSRTANRFRGL